MTEDEGWDDPLPYIPYIRGGKWEERSVVH